MFYDMVSYKKSFLWNSLQVLSKNVFLIMSVN